MDRDSALVRSTLQSENSELIRKFNAEYLVDQKGQPIPEIKLKKFNDGSEYRGTTDKGKKVGIGLYRFYSGEVYFGEWDQDLMQGKGVLIEQDSERYEGYFDRGAKHGQGNYYALDGSVYKGEWVNGKKEGRGLLKLPNGDRYEGYFYRDKMQGSGVFNTFHEQYVGEFSNGYREGEGELKYQNGTIYQGSFKKGLPEGKI